MKISTFLFIALTIFSASAYPVSVGQNNQSVTIRQDIPSAKREPIANDFAHHVWSWSTQSGPIGPAELNYFITNIYNCPLYAQDYLPNTFSDMLRFLTHGNHTYKNRSYVQQVMRLFSNKLKACQYINAQAFSQLLDELPKLLERHFVTPKLFDVDLVQRQVSLSIEKYLKNTHKPSSTSQGINDLSKEIVQELETTYRTTTHTTSVEELRKTTQSFLEVGLSKLIWSPEDGNETWQSTKKISHQLARLMEFAIIEDVDDLNDAFITLLERYCHFVELMAEDLTPDFYLTIAQDLKKNIPSLLDLDEQEPSIEPKLQRFQRTLANAQSITSHAFERKQLHTHARKLADEHGIIMHKTKIL